MAQNVYDRPDFFNAYIKQIDRSTADLTTDKAWLRFQKFIPADLTGSDVLDLGCGTGWVSRVIVDRGAKSVLGYDISEKMLTRARELTDGDKYANIEYRQADLDHLELSEEHDGKYDYIVSALAMHYLVNLPDLVRLIHRVLKPGGTFACNIEHPIHTAPAKARVITDEATGEKCWSFNSYYKEGERVTDWLAPGIKKQHRTLTSYMSMFLGTGFDMVQFLEWLPTEQELQAGEVQELDQIRPVFLMMSWKKPA